ncbi:6-pyruvoyl trahydropterin synthase family protein [Tenacibaculum piscium]|uniref:6-carboxy-5,6,7,8-tetrahydropterin synthase n=1 Tax=Tenacibaculum piscium TaxID=1458515 RepID=A0A2H1YF38_9FLAO|nr:6-carboxytetrahydropterin synthase [Tenacibaculum piscium]MBE7628934.1 6-carboxytetrahydropterin synthase [Tenacibaculum piscium]MBE7671237.1 6-carboxytetrahydropterin synthase [Tenacibaculum piscium]MBE7685045.1 6-carboxytetrahydropterin synthase [Tenacibaculum piscium]MBE7689748.1 6-carboxytetrahydropterin synthase [Tenacibaculum piscium]MCG8183613.1 6-carboxytetrahydropterin synthase [Tenacibaculum piscium]
MPKVTVHRKAHFNAAHRLFNEKWSAEKNFEIFGKCSNPNYHGHNYDLIVSLTGEIDPETGFVYDLGKLKNVIKSEIENSFDHKNLNIDVPDFQNLNPTAENISVVIFNKLRVCIPEKLALSITLYETRRNYVTYSGA